jgi:hypothetical protein
MPAAAAAAAIVIIRRRRRKLLAGPCVQALGAITTCAGSFVKCEERTRSGKRDYVRVRFQQRQTTIFVVTIFWWFFK